MTAALVISSQHSSPTNPEKQETFTAQSPIDLSEKINPLQPPLDLYLINRALVQISPLPTEENSLKDPLNSPYHSHLKVTDKHGVLQYHVKTFNYMRLDHNMPFVPVGVKLTTAEGTLRIYDPEMEKVIAERKISWYRNDNKSDSFSVEVKSFETNDYIIVNTEKYNNEYYNSYNIYRFDKEKQSLKMFAKVSNPIFRETSLITWSPNHPYGLTFSHYGLNGSMRREPLKIEDCNRLWVDENDRVCLGNWIDGKGTPKYYPQLLE